jgi:hypothetical protein
MESMKLLVRAGTRSVSSLWRRDRTEGGASRPCPAYVMALVRDGPATSECQERRTQERRGRV